MANVSLTSKAVSVAQSASPFRLAQALGRGWRDLPALTRLGGHVLLMALIVVALWSRLPDELPIPQLGPWAVAPQEAQVSSEQLALSDPDEPSRYLSRTTRYLQQAAVPYTRRAVVNTGALPEVELQRSVRTSITVYTVQGGDSVLGIAEKFGLEGNSLLWANPRLADNPDFLQVGQTLNILPVNGALHTVAKGETLEAIAARYKVTPEVISGYVGNGLSNGAALAVGASLIIPGGIKPYVARQVTAYQGTAPENAKVGSGNFVWPTSGYVSQKYWEGHRAIDIAGRGNAGGLGAPVLAADAGYVAATQVSNSGYGRMVILDHGNGYQTLYAHLQTFYVEVGQSVSRGEAIGKVGSTGNSTGPHLHFEVIQNGVRRNPFSYLP
jgi:murein DD-endopeptidase MepM/ murein hydrolase activator NlpD